MFINYLLINFLIILFSTQINTRILDKQNAHKNKILFPFVEINLISILIVMFHVKHYQKIKSKETNIAQKIINVSRETYSNAKKLVL